MKLKLSRADVAKLNQELTNNNLLDYVEVPIHEEFVVIEDETPVVSTPVETTESAQSEVPESVLEVTEDAVPNGPAEASV